jgi:glycerate kinase
LCGENGCSRVYGPQKGADAEMIEVMDKWLLNYSELAKSINDKADRDFPGSGAAGGLGFAFMTFLNGTLREGIELILSETKLEEYIKNADIVVTGEGRLDSQTVMGKAPIGVARIAKKYNLPVIAFSGCVTEDAGVCNSHGIDCFFPILREVCSLEDAMDSQKAYKNMISAVEQVFRLISVCGI